VCKAQVKRALPESDVKSDRSPARGIAERAASSSRGTATRLAARPRPRRQSLSKKATPRRARWSVQGSCCAKLRKTDRYRIARRISVAWLETASNGERAVRRKTGSSASVLSAVRRRRAPRMAQCRADWCKRDPDMRPPRTISEVDGSEQRLDSTLVGARLERPG